MATVAVYNMQGAEVGKMDLNDAIFGVEVNEHLVKMVVTAHLAAERQGTQKAKTRSEVSGGGRKPWKQKGPVTQDRVHKSSAVDRRWCCIRSSTERLHH